MQMGLNLSTSSSAPTVLFFFPYNSDPKGYEVILIVVLISTSLRISVVGYFFMHLLFIISFGDMSI